MGLSNYFDNNPSSGVRSRSYLGLSSMFNQPQEDEDKSLDQRLSNAHQKLMSVGMDVPQPESHSSVMDKLFGALNYLNNKKNQAIAYASGDREAFSHDVSGADLMEMLGIDNKYAKNILGFGFDAVTDPLNALTFGTAGVATKGLGLGVKGAEALSKARPVAKLSAHIPFTKIGASVDIPGSSSVLEGLSNIASKGKGKIGDFIDAHPTLANAVDANKKLIGKTFNRNYGLPEGVGEVTQRAQDYIRISNQDTVKYLARMRKGWESVGHTFEDDIKIIKAVENPEKYLGDLGINQTKVYNDVKDFFDMTYVRAREAGVLEDFVQNYIPHIFNGPKDKVREALEQVRRKGPKLRTTTPFGNPRTLMKDLGEIMDDPQLANILKPETNLSKLMGIYKVSLEKAIANRDMLDELLALDGIVVKASKTVVDEKGVAKKVSVSPPASDWVKDPIAQIKGYWVNPEVAGHLKDILEPFNNNIEFNKLLKHYDGVLGWWKFMATVPNAGFHVRNAIGNIWNNYLGGVKDIGAYKVARQAQKADDILLDDFRDILNSVDPLAKDLSSIQMPNTGIDPRESFMQRLFDDDRIKLIMHAGKGSKVNVPVTYNGRTINLNGTGVKFLSKLMGVTHKGMFIDDIGEDIMKQLGRGVKGEYNPGSRNFIGWKKAEKGGISLEDNARMAHFITKLQEGMNPWDASNSVKKYLFDYTELSPVEKNVLRRVIPFYSFTRYNLPLQLRELVKQPKYAAMAAKFQNFMGELSQDVTGVEGDERGLPKYLSNLYSFRLPFQVGADRRDLFMGVDLPLRDINNLDPKEWITMITPIVMAPMEQAFNRNLYFGRDIERFGDETVKAPGYLQGLFRLAEAGDPDIAYNETFKKLMSVFHLTIATNEDGSAELRVPARLSHGLNQLVALKNLGKGLDAVMGEVKDPFASSSFLTGVTMVSNTEAERNRNIKYQQLNKLEDLIRKLQDEGTQVPTMSELQKGGNGLDRLFGGR